MHVQCDLDFPEKLHIYIHIEDTHRQAYNTQAIAMCIYTHRTNVIKDYALCHSVILELLQDVASLECALSVISLTRPTEQSHRVTRFSPTGLAEFVKFWSLCKVFFKYLNCIYFACNIFLATVIVIDFHIYFVSCIYLFLIFIHFLYFVCKVKRVKIILF